MNCNTMEVDVEWGTKQKNIDSTKIIYLITNINWKKVIQYQNKINKKWKCTVVCTTARKYTGTYYINYRCIYTKFIT